MLSEKEKEVLAQTSRIRSNVFPPFADADLQEQFWYPFPFTDQVCFSSEINTLECEMEVKIKICSFHLRMGFWNCRRSRKNTPLFGQELAKFPNIRIRYQKLSTAIALTG